MTENDEIIVLHYTRYGEKSVVLHCLTRKYGRRGLLVRSGGATALFQPLNILEGDVGSNSRSSMMSVKNLCEGAVTAGIRFSASKNAISMFIAEVLYRSLREDACDSALFDALRGEILLLDRLQSNFANFHLRFLLDYASALGFRPSGADLLPFAEDCAAWTGRLAGCTFAEAMAVPLTREQRNKICAALLRYLEFHMEMRLNIKSLAVLEELFV